MIWSNFGLQDKVPILSCHEAYQDKLTHPDYHPFLGWTMYNTTHQILLVWTYARKQHRWNEGEIFRINTMYYRSNIIVEPWTISISEKVNPHYSVIKKCEIRGVYTIKRRNHIFVLMKYYFFVEIYEIIVKSIENSLTFPNYISLSRIRYIPYPTDSISHLFPLWGRFFYQHTTRIYSFIKQREYFQTLTPQGACALRGGCVVFVYLLEWGGDWHWRFT